jgi:hypothetical protein
VGRVSGLPGPLRVILSARRSFRRPGLLHPVVVALNIAQSRFCHNLSHGRHGRHHTVGSTLVPRGQRTAAAWQDCAVRLSTFPHPRASTAIRRLVCTFIQIVHRSIHSSLRWLAWAGVIGASSQARPVIRGERGGQWPGDSAVSPTSGVHSRRPTTRRATTCPLAGTRPRRAGPATQPRGLGAGTSERARHRAAAAPDWHRVRWAGPGTPAGWKLRGIGTGGWLSWSGCTQPPCPAAWQRGPAIAVMVRTPNHEDPRCRIGTC